MNPEITGVYPPPSAILDNAICLVLPSIATIGLAVLLWKIGTTARHGGTFHARGSLTIEAIGGVAVTCLGAAWNLAVAEIPRLAELRDRRLNVVDMIPTPTLAAILAAPAVLGIAVGIIALRRKQNTHAGRLEPKTDLV